MMMITKNVYDSCRSGSLSVSLRYTARVKALHANIAENMGPERKNQFNLLDSLSLNQRAHRMNDPKLGIMESMMMLSGHCCFFILLPSMEIYIEDIEMTG